MEYVSKYGVQFDLFSKSDINGPNALTLYQFLRNSAKGPLGSLVRWNFGKFLVDKKGVPFKRYEPNTAPEDILPDIIELLKR